MVEIDDQETALPFICLLRAGNYRANVPESHDCEGDGLKKKVYEVVVLSVQEVIHSAGEKKHCKPKLVQVDPEKEVEIMSHCHKI